ncbi:MAG TPA: D-alanyl-D-alanine carboxypeptidase family protein [Candidatus Binataceae bacterium]|nr:D-alanyl-D-alanine carboxypeptidase family protein [Candidatus Binataceae bacterium]
MINLRLCGTSYVRRLIFALTLCCLLAASSFALTVRHHVPKRAEPVEPLSQIQVLDNHPAPFALDARAAILVAAHTGAVLYAYNEHTRMQPASLAKIMTFYLTLEALKTGRIKLDTPINISQAAWRLSIDKTVSKMFLEVGQQVDVRDLLLGLMVSSGNDAALALAEYLGGSSDGFVTQMNDACRKLGLNETHFSSPDGLPEPDQYTTAADMAKLAQIVLDTHPEALTYTSTKEFTFHGITQRNWNTLLFYDSRVNGLKTGHVDEAGFHLVATAHSNGIDLISVLLGTPNAEKRRTETKKLIDWAFNTFVTVSPQWRDLVPNELRVYEGSANTVAIGPARTPEITVYKGEESHIKLMGTMNSEYLIAPIGKDAPVGVLTMLKDDKPIVTIPIETQAQVERGGFFHVMGDRIRLLFHRLFHGIGYVLLAPWRFVKSHL